MGKASKKLVGSVVDDLPIPSELQEYAVVLNNNGGGLYEILLQNGEKCLARMPSKFRDVLFIRKGQHFLVQVEPLATEKVKATIITAVFLHHVKELRRRNLWPAKIDEVAAVEFGSKVEALTVAEDQENKAEEKSEEEGSESDDGEAFVVMNRNRRPQHFTKDESEDDDSDDE